MTKTSYNSPNSYIFPVYAEENAALANTSYEWAYGNGANCPSDCGIVMYVPDGAKCYCVAMGLSLNGATPSATVRLVVNGSALLNVYVSNLSQQQFWRKIDPPYEIVNNDYVNVYTLSASNTSGPCQAVAWFKMILQA